MKDGKVVLLGGAGLVGLNLLQVLEEAGYQELVVIDKHNANVRTGQALYPRVKFIEADLAQAGSWENALQSSSAAVMLQAQIGAGEPEPFIRNNIESTRVALKAIQAADVPYLVHISSSVVNSAADDDYTRRKRRQEEMVLESGLRCTVLRPTLMFGWFDRKHLGWLSRFMKRVPVFPIPGHGRYMRQPLYVRDFCRIILSCLQQRGPEGVFDITGVERIDYIEMIRTIRQVTHARCLILPMPYRAFWALLALWGLFDRNPPFTTDQLEALVAGDEFDVIDWPKMFGVTATSLEKAMKETFADPRFSHVELAF